RHAALGRDEVRRTRRVHDVFIGSVYALFGIGVQQRIRRLALEDELELPDEIVGILDARVGTSRTEWRDLMRGITDKQCATMPEAAHAATLEGIDADPFQLEFTLVAQHRPDAGNDVLGTFF